MNIPEINFQARGPEGIQRRLAEIRARAGVVDHGFSKELEQIDGEEQSSSSGELKGNIAPMGIAPVRPDASMINPLAARGEYESLARDIAKQYGLDPKLLVSVITQESSWNPNAISKQGAVGLMQLMPETAQELGVVNPFNPKENIAGGAKYLKGLIDEFGDIKTALAAYNAGPGKVRKVGGIPNYPETQSYIKSILSRVGSSR